MPEWYQLNDRGSIDSPSLLVFPERVRHNINTAIRMVGDVQRLRPHIKTNKSAGAVCMMMEAGINKFKCATIAEAEMLGMVWAKDVLLAYQPTGPKLQRFIELIRCYPNTKYSCLTDNILIAKEQATAFAAAGLRVPVYVDINVGMNRTGISPGPDLLALIRFLQEEESVEKVGLHVYDGHIRNSNYAEKEKEVEFCYQPVEELLKEIAAAGWLKPEVVVGGSPSFSVHCKRKEVECSPGTFVYWDYGYSQLCPEQDFLPAAVLMTRVISLPGPGLVTTDLGHKSVAAENEIVRRVFILGEHKLAPLSQSEEHLVLRNESLDVYAPGDILYGLPFHICPTVALYERVLTVENGNLAGEWLNTARDRKINA